MAIIRDIISVVSTPDNEVFYYGYRYNIWYGRVSAPDNEVFYYGYRYNIRYGRVSAPDNELENAARAADIHERILTFPDGL